MSRRMVLLGFVVLLVVGVFAGSVFAQYSSDPVERSLDRITDWITKVLGAALVVIGVVIVGIKMSMGDQEALKKGALVIVGGLIIFLAKDLLSLIKGFAGQ